MNETTRLSNATFFNCKTIRIQADKASGYIVLWLEGRDQRSSTIMIFGENDDAPAIVREPDLEKELADD